MATFPTFSNPAQSGAPDRLNEALETLEHQAVYGKDQTATSGLIWGYYGGRWGGFSIAAGTVTLTGATDNYLVVEIATGALTKSTSTTNWNDATNYARVYKITTTTVVTAVEDHRAGPGGVHGGVAGTSSSSFLSWKDPVRAATTTNGTLATAFANGQTIDGVTLATGDRILLKNQSTASQNGIYVVAASGAPARSSDADSGTELVNATVFVSEGSTLADTLWTCSTNATITPGSTSLTFTQVGAGSSFTGGTLTSPINDAPRVTVSSASTANIGAANSNAIDISGTSTILAFDSIADGAQRICRFLGALTLTHNASSLILPSGANITTAAGDVAAMRSLGSGNWLCEAFVRKSGTALITTTTLTAFTEALNTASPNNTVNNSSFSASGGSSSQGIALVWKGGSGYLSVDIPDSSSTGGNVRGATAVDLQKTRSTAAAVASGAASFIGAGQNNTASGANAGVVGAASSTASGDQSFAQGNAVVADGTNGVAMGIGSTNRGVPSFSYSSCSQGTGTGDSQIQMMTMRRNSAFSATPVVLSTNGSTPSSTTIPVLPNTSSMLFRAFCLTSDGTDNFAVEIVGAITRGANAASTALLGTPTVTTIGASGGVAGKSWAWSATADTTNGGLNINMTPDAGGLVRGVCSVTMMQNDF